MTNTLCTPTCFGFPTEGASGVPTSPVICKASELVVKSPKIRFASRLSSSQDINVGVTTGQTYDGSAVNYTATNPWDVNALIMVHHEFVFTHSVADADQWREGALITAGGNTTLYTGGTSLTLTMFGNNGTNFANDDKIISRVSPQNFTMLYYVTPGGVISITQTTRVVYDNIRSGFRSLQQLLGAMTVDIQPTYP